VPLFNLLGVPDEQKQLARFDGAGSRPAAAAHHRRQAAL
jgi:hypothetical protein